MPILSRPQHDAGTLEFNEVKHLYLLDGKHVPGVTTVLKLYPIGEGLIQWKIKQGIEEHLTGVKLKKAADIGTRVHELAEKIDKGEPFDEKEESEEIENCKKALKAWKKEAKDERVSGEQIVASRKYRFAGKFDRLSKDGDKLILSDFKTSKQTYETSFVQLAAYCICLEDWMDLTPDIIQVIRLDKTDGIYEIHQISFKKTIKDYKEQFIRLLGTYKFMKKYER